MSDETYTRQQVELLLDVFHRAAYQLRKNPASVSLGLADAIEAYQNTEKCMDDLHRGTECKCCHAIRHCCSHHCCCFYRGG